MPFGQGTDLLELLDDRATLEAGIASAKGRLTQLNQKIAEQTKDAIAAAFLRAQKTDGTVKFAVGNRIYKAVVDKRVEWDSDALEDIARQLPLETAREIFKVKYSMAEAVFRGIDVPSLKAKLTIARAVKYGEPKVSVADEKDT